MYIAKMTTHSYSLMQIPTSRLAISIIRIALKIQDKVEAVKDYQTIMYQILDFSGIQASEIKECS